MGDVIEVLTTATNTVEVAATGPQGAPGVGVPTGGSALQVLRKVSSTNYDTEWAAAGSGSGSVTSVAFAGTGLSISGSPVTTSGTITANVTYGTTAGTATQGNDSRIADIAASSITTKQGANSGGAGGTITMRGGITGTDGNGGNAGSINLQGSDNRSAGSFNGGSINLSAGDGGGGSITSVGGGNAFGGSLTMSGGSQGSGGSINTSNAGGAINTSSEGGAINTSSGGGAINTSEGGGAINTSDAGGAINTSGFEGTAGGDILTYGGEQAGGSILTYGGEQAGGSVETYDGGGSINTRGTGSIQFGATGTRTTLGGTATANRAISLPNASGTIATTAQATDYEVTDSTKGIILKSPNNTRWRLTINDDGTLSRAALALMTLLAFATSGLAQVRDMVTDTNGNIVTGRTNVLTFTNSVNIPIYSGAATTNSILTADGAGSSSFVVSRTVTRFTTNDQTKTNWAFNAASQTNNNDTQMGSWSLDANSMYRVEYAVAWVATTNSGFAHGLGFSTNLSEFNHRTGVGQAANTTVTAISTGTNVTAIALANVSAASTGGRFAVAGFVYVLTSSNANTMNYRWYPINNSADATTLVRSSMLSVTKMAP
jgi:hypothetical protein